MDRPTRRAKVDVLGSRPKEQRTLRGRQRDRVAVGDHPLVTSTPEVVDHVRVLGEDPRLGLETVLHVDHLHVSVVEALSVLLA